MWPYHRRETEIRKDRELKNHLYFYGNSANRRLLSILMTSTGPESGKYMSLKISPFALLGTRASCELWGQPRLVP